MAILGLGIDLVELDHFQRKLSKRFLSRVYAEEELAYCLQKKDATPSLAARFAAKEAVIKAFAWRLFSQSLKDIVVIKEEDQPPRIELRGKALENASKLGNYKIFVSLTHTANLAMAEVIVAGGEVE